MAEKKNQAQLRLEAHQKKMIQFQEDIKNLGNPNDYTNKANYTGKVNELRKKYGVVGLKGDLNTYMNKLKREENKLKKVVTSRYIKRAPVSLLERLVIDDYDNIGSKYSNKNTLGTKINPDYVESLDPTGETQLKKDAAEKLRIQNQNAALAAGAIEREGNEWGPGGQPSATSQYTAAGLDLGNLNAGTLLGKSKLTITGSDYVDSGEQAHYQSQIEDPDSAYNQQTRKGNLKEGTANRKEYAITKDQYREFGAQLEQMKKMGASQAEINKRLLKIKNSPITSLGMEM